MFAASAIRRHINGLSENDVFYNREFLVYALRSQVDLVLHQLCKKGDIIRLARGVYRKTPRDMQKAWIPSVAEIAAFKAQAFGRKIVAEFADAASKLIPGMKGHTEVTFATDGAPSSFMTSEGVQIRFVRRCARKVALDDDLVRMAIKAAWHAGKEVVEHSLFYVTQTMWRQDKRLFRALALLMPAWMSDALKDKSRKGTNWQEYDKEEEQKEQLRRIQKILAEKNGQEYFDCWEFCRQQQLEHLAHPEQSIEPDYMEWVNSPYYPTD